MLFDSWPTGDCIARFHDRVPSYRQQGMAAVGAAVFAADGKPMGANRPALNLFRQPAEVLELTAGHSRSFRDLYRVPHSLLGRSGRQLDVDSISFVGLCLDLGGSHRRTILDADLVVRHDTNAGGAASPWLSPAWKHYYMVRNSFLMNRSLPGLWYVLTVTTTLRQQGRDVWQFLQEAWMANHRGGVMPSLLPEP